MELEHITQERCPSCGASPTSETKNRQHCSGEWNESRTFSCGRSVQYSPNFRREDVARECQKHPNEISKQEKRKIAKDRLFTYINKLDVDKDFTRRLLSSIEYL